LDAIRRDVTTLPIEDVPTPQITLTSVPLVSFQPQVLAQLPYASLRTSTSGASSFVPRILFGFSANDGSKQWPVGVFSAGLDAQNLIMHAGDGTILLDVHENGILMAHNANLYVLRGEKTRLLSDQTLQNSPQPAIWLADNRVAAILRSGDTYQIAIIPLDDSTQVFLPALADAVPYQLYRSLDPVSLYWSTASCTQAKCPSGVMFSSRLDGTSSRVIPYYGQPAFASDGQMAFLGHNEDGKNQITLVYDGEERRLQIPGTRLVDAVWSPDSEVLAVHSTLVSNYSARILRSWLYFIDNAGILNGVLFVDDEAIERVAWSPDGQSLLVVRRPTQGPYVLNFSVFNRMQRSENQTLGFTLTSASYALPAPIFWLP
jgi:hypothetical protein